MQKLLYPLIALLALAGCNTLQGAGQDISTAGNTLTEEAAEAEN